MLRSHLKKALFALSLSLTAIPFVAANCLPVDGQCNPDDATSCENIDQICNPNTLVCEDSCLRIDGLCSGETPVCQPDGERAGVCVCDETSCPEGTVCQADGTCGDGDPVGGDCTNNGDLNEDETQVCVDGTFQPICGDVDCAASDETFCDFDFNSASFNQCGTDPDSVTNSCSPGNKFDAGHESGGPLLLPDSTTLDREDGFDGACDDANPGTEGFAVNAIAFSDDLLEFDFNSFQWASDDVGPITGTLNGAVVGLDGFDDVYAVVIAICFQNGAPDQVAAQIEDGNGNKSNVACSAE